MELSHIAFLLFATFSALRIISYLPQIHRVATDENGASAISYSTWFLWIGANVSTALYAILNLHDQYLASVSIVYAVCCAAVIVLTFVKRRLYQDRMGVAQSEDPQVVAQALAIEPNRASSRQRVGIAAAAVMLLGAVYVGIESTRWEWPSKTFAATEDDARRTAADAGEQQTQFEGKRETGLDEKRRRKEEEGRIAREQAAPREAAQRQHDERARQHYAKGEQFHARGHKHLKEGNIPFAREFFRRAAEIGLQQSALALAETYDPRELGTTFLIVGVQPDVERARHWYEKARELGAKEAEARIQRLNRTGS